MWLSANLKVYRFLLPYSPYTKRWQTLAKDEVISTDNQRYIYNYFI